MALKRRTISNNDEIGFFDHLEALRWHIIRSLLAIAVGAVTLFLNKHFLFDVLIFGPKKVDFWTYRILCDLSTRFHLGDDLCIKKIPYEVVNLDMSGQFVTHMYIAFMGGLVLGFPYLIWEIWRFIKPALKERERKGISGSIGWISFLFFVGVVFGYYVLTPLSMNFLASYQISEDVANRISLDSYIETLIGMVLACGLIFEFPMIIFIVAKIGLLTHQHMRTYRKYAILVILIVAGWITPGPDVFSQLIVATPLYLLYEASIWVARRVVKQRADGDIQV